MTWKPLAADDLVWDDKDGDHPFERLDEGRYRLAIPECATTFEIDRLYRDRYALCGELLVTTQLKGARTFKGTLFSGAVNLTDAYRRRDTIRLLEERSRAKDIDWAGLLDELQIQVVAAERSGSPPIVLRDASPPPPEEVYELEGLALPKTLPAVLFGDGGTFKSYLALFVAGWLANQGVKVLYVDFELNEGEHRGRLAELFGSDLPRLFYKRYQRPMREEIDGIVRFIHEQSIGYVVVDSVGFAAAGNPEASETAIAYAGFVRRFGAGVGSLHLAHVTKQSEDAPDPKYPFGSIYWHNFGRMTWFVKRTTDTLSADSFSLALVHRKTNISHLRPPVGLEVAFSDGRIGIRRIDVASVDEFATKLKVGDRVAHALKGGLRTVAEIVAETNAKEDTVKKTLDRGRNSKFVCVTQTPDGIHRWGLREGRYSAAS